MIFTIITLQHTFVVEGQKMMLDNRLYHMIAGELHYNRIPYQYWRHRIQMTKSMGINTISMYIFWNFHEETEGVFDFKSKQKNITRFIEICEEEGMFVTIRPGPYVCAEWDFGGFPTYLLQNISSQVRTFKDTHFKQAVERYFKECLINFQKQLVQNGGIILMLQLENELGHWPKNRIEKEYMDWLRNTWIGLGVNIPLYTADSMDTGYTNITHCPNCLLGLNSPVVLDSTWEKAHAFDPNVPVFIAELYPGKLRHWGDENWAIRNASQTVEQAMNRTVNNVDIRGFCFYLAHGGSNIGFTAGAHKAQNFQPLLTSYNEAAPIDESGRPTQMYHEYRDIIFKYLNVTKPIVPNDLNYIEIEQFNVHKTGNLLEQAYDFQKTLDKPMHFEHFLQNQGIIVYSTVHKKSPNGVLKFDHLHDIGYIFLNKRYTGQINTVKIKNNQYQIDLPETQEDQLLEIVVDTFGHVCYGIEMESDRKGIFGDVYFNNNKSYYQNWTHTSRNLRNFSITYVNKSSQIGQMNIYTGSFNLENIGDTFLNTTSLKKGMLWVNDINLGRYWEVGPQHCLYLPGVYLQKGQNKIVVLEMEGNNESYELHGVTRGCL